MKTRFTSVLALTLALGACASQPGEFVGGNGDSSYGSELPIKKPPSTNKPATPPKGPTGPTATHGAIAITVTSPNGSPIAGVTLIYRGASMGTLVTDAKGVARKSGVKGGSYTVDVDSCGTLVRILGGGGGADFTVVPGRTSAFPIPNIGWEPRYQPVERVQSSPSPPWKDGSTFAITVEVYDMCTNKRAAVIANLAPWEFVPSGAIRFAQKPVMKSTSKGSLHATFTCNGVGEGDIVLRDPRDGRRFIHVVGALPGATAFNDICES